MFISVNIIRTTWHREREKSYPNSYLFHGYIEINIKNHRLLVILLFCNTNKTKSCESEVAVPHIQHLYTRFEITTAIPIVRLINVINEVACSFSQSESS